MAVRPMAYVWHDEIIHKTSVATINGKVYARPRAKLNIINTHRQQQIWIPRLWALISI